MVPFTYAYFDFIIDTHHNVKRSEKSHNVTIYMCVLWFHHLHNRLLLQDTVHWFTPHTSCPTNTMVQS